MSAPVKGDALLLALAAEYRSISATVETMDEEDTRWSGAMKLYLCKHGTARHFHRDAIATGMAAIKADGIPGALVQIELLARMNEQGEPTDDSGERQRDQLRDALVWSIYNVLAKTAGPAKPEGIGFMELYRDVLRDDMDQLIIEWRQMFDAEGLEYAKVHRRPAGVKS